mgnify:CR=1 FL=1
MRLGIDSYSLRWQGWDAFQLLEYSARIGLDNVHYSSRHGLASLDEDYLLSLKRRAADLGLQVEVGMGSFDRYSSSFDPTEGSGEQQLSDMLKAAAVVGSPVVRCLLGSQAERGQAQPLEQLLLSERTGRPPQNELGEKLVAQQRLHFEESVRYAHEVLGLGERR